MPRPEQGESQSHFVSRYAFNSPEAKQKFPKDKQRMAIAYSLYRQRHLVHALRSKHA